MVATLKDIARAAGVSVTTVSLVLRENPHPMISLKTRERVLEVAKELKYRHNLHARALRMGKTQLIGLLMFDLDTRIALLKLEAIDAAVTARGYRSLIRNAAGHADMEPQFIREYAGGAVEGLIIVQPTGELSAKSLEPLLSSDVPIVTLEPIEGSSLDCVTVDREHGAYVAVKHLLNLGHRRIGMLHAEQSDLHFAPRLEGYRKALSEYGIEIDESLLVETRVSYHGGCEAARELIERKTGATALFCDNDEVAIGAMKAVRGAGLRIPDDMALIGFDNIEAGAFAPVPLTTVAQPVDDVAALAVEMLFARMDGSAKDRPAILTRLKPHLVVRESCGGS